MPRVSVVIALPSASARCAAEARCSVGRVSRSVRSIEGIDGHDYNLSSIVAVRISGCFVMQFSAPGSCMLNTNVAPTTCMVEVYGYCDACECQSSLASFLWMLGSILQCWKALGYVQHTRRTPAMLFVSIGTYSLHGKDRRYGNSPVL